MGFSERMEGVTKELHACASERASAVSEVRAGAQQLLADARSFMHRVSQECKDRAGQLRSTLADDRREGQDQVRTMRHQVVADLGKMREHLRGMLDHDCRTRHQTVAALKSAFETARTALVKDLRESARIWRCRASASPTKPCAAPHLKAGTEPVRDRDYVVETNVIGHWQAPAVGEDFGATKTHEHHAGS